MATAPAYHESLPYIDKEPSAEALSAAHALIAAEASSSPPLQPSSPVPLNLTPALTQELTRISTQTPSTTLPLSHYEAQEPLPSAPVSQLKTSLSNAYTSSTYLSSREQNLTLLDTHGKNTWLLGNFELEAELKRLEAELADTKREIDVVNLERKRRQEEVKGEVDLLEEGWRRGVGRVLETEVAVEELKARIREELRSQGQS